MDEGAVLSDSAFKSAVELAQMIKNRDIGCLELLDHCLAWVERYNPALNAIVGQVFWAALATCSYLPGTVIPTGASAEGLPIGVQIIGPECGDLKGIGLVNLLEQEDFACVPPPGYGAS